jgi:predicted NBD/HSP70 family sugar kinase
MARREFLKALNRSAILNIIKTYGPIARTDIARLSGLSPAAVTGLTAELIEDGLVFEKQEGDSRGGRKPILLALDASHAYVVGIKLAEESATLALTDLNSEVLAQHSVLLTRREPVPVSDLLAEGVRELLRSAQVDHDCLLGIGVGLAGLIDSNAGICRVSPHNGWRDVPFAHLLEERLDCPVYLDNNVNTLTRVEQLYGVGQHVKDFLVVTIGRGVGLGIVANGQVYRGAHGAGGEFGHIVVDPDGLVCNCGNRGCLETFVAEPWLLRRAHLAGLEVSTPEELVAKAKAGNPTAIETLSRAGAVFGQALSTLVNLLEPALIIISGEGVRAGEFMFAPMRDAMAHHIFDRQAERIELRIEPLSDDTWARGAASLVLARIFHAPQLERQAALPQ